MISYHKRRYTTFELTKKLISNGFSIDYLSECMQILYPLAKLRRKAPIQLDSETVENKLKKSFTQELAIIPVINEIAFQVLKIELNQIKQRKQITRGTSIIAIASKRTG